jgi:hypothetical protein
MLVLGSPAQLRVRLDALRSGLRRVPVGQELQSNAEAFVAIGVGHLRFGPSAGLVSNWTVMPKARPPLDHDFRQRPPARALFRKRPEHKL